jgi:hypothetical protein
LTEYLRSVKLSDMARRKTTVYVDEDLLRAAKVRAARTGQKDYQVFEAALKEFLGFGILERAGRRSELTEEEAMALANEAVHQVRASRE